MWAKPGRKYALFARRTEDIGPVPAGTETPCRSLHGGRAGVSLAELRRQDSNLNCLNQNQKCCRLHHDGSLRPAVKTASTLDDHVGRSRTAVGG
jgi:hypothetical protein